MVSLYKKNNDIYCKKKSVIDSDYNIELYNLNGKLIYFGIFESKRDVIKINGAVIPPGMYFVNIRNEKNSFLFKFINF